MENIDKILKKRANTTQYWLSSDTPSNYKPVNLDYGRNRFSSTEIKYKFNEHGFRCDSFSKRTDFPIIFLGCSITEGVGLHLEQTWANLILEKIKTYTNIDIPYWSLALAASGIDTQSRLLYWFNNQQFIKPKLIINLIPPLSRREFSYKESKNALWISSEKNNKEINKVFLDQDFAYHQSYKSYMLLDTLSNCWNSKIINAQWDYFDSTQDSSFVKENFRKFNHVDIGDWKEINKSWARDGKHWGSEMHIHIAETFWASIKNLIS